jgi:putative membrane protein
MFSFFANSQNQSSNSSYKKASTATSNSKKRTTLVLKDEDFINRASKAGMEAVEMGNLAKTKATNERVKSFADMMVRDHSKVNGELNALITKPRKAVSINQATVHSLDHKMGTDFDKAYMDMIIRDHKATVDLFTNESLKGRDQKLKDFAARTLPTLKMHQDSAIEIRASLGK